ncbi:MAG: XdhC family protein [Actinomycetota bacterium]|nr:XdhC family protein [Actinomycetota bacterium]
MTDTLADLARAMLSAGERPTVTARVVDIQGFSTWPGDEVVIVDEEGVRHGQLFGVAGAARLREAASPLLRPGVPPALGSAVVEIHGSAVEEAGLSCGGRAELLLQTTATIPAALWELLGSRTPAVLLTRIEGPGRSPASQVVAADGRIWGAVAPPAPVAVAEAVHLLRSGHSATRRVEDPAGTVLVEAWVPAPRMVVVGTGDLVDALSAQGRLLGWDATAVDNRPQPHGDWPALAGAFAWAGGSAALVVLSHDPHVDAPALAAGLDAGLPYVGAMGSRATQSRRSERLRARGVSDAQLDRIHRPIGLDLGGRSAPEVALAICAEILACHCGHDARPLSDRTGPINDRPAAGAVPH